MEMWVGEKRELRSVKKKQPTQKGTANEKASDLYIGKRGEDTEKHTYLSGV